MPGGGSEKSSATNCHCLECAWDRKAIRNSITKFAWEDSAKLYMQAYLRAMGGGKVIDYK